MGDSKTAGDTWPTLLIDSLNAITPNQPYGEFPDQYATSGYAVSEMHTYIDANLAGETVTPGKIIINLGANDSATAENDFKADYRAIIEALHAKWVNTLIYLARPVVLSDVPPSSPTAANANVRGWIDDVIAEYAYVYAGIDETDLEGGDSYATNLTDVTHYTTAGQTAVANLWLAILTA